MMRSLYIALLATGLSVSAIPAFAQAAPIPKAADLSAQEMAGAFSKIDGDHVVGSSAAPVTMILYASVTCPHCSSWFKSEWPNLKRDYIETGKLQVVFREFPTEPANLAIAGFQIANCAPESDYMDIITHQMVNQDEIIEQVIAGHGEARYLEIAKLAGLNTAEEMNTCIRNEAGFKRLTKAGQLANAADIKSVPSAVIAGEKYEGNLNYLQLSRYIDSLSGQSFTPMPKSTQKSTR